MNRGVGVASIEDGDWDLKELGNVTFLNKLLKFQTAYAIWMPLNVQDEVTSSDIISQNRFEDNEVLLPHLSLSTNM